MDKSLTDSESTKKVGISTVEKEELKLSQKSEKSNVRCNCDDEFKTETCPIHFQISDKFNKEVIVITDKNMVPEEIRQWHGYAYECPRCGEASILDIMKYCGNCGVGIVLQSTKLTSFINELTERNNGR